MSEVIARPRAAKSNAAPARPMLTENDRLAVAVGSQIFWLLAPINEGPFVADNIPGYNYIVEAGNEAWDLCNIEADWAGEGAPPTVADLVPRVRMKLHKAMVEMIANESSEHAALMHCVRLLVADALAIATDLLSAYRGLPDTSADLIALTSFQRPESAPKTRHGEAERVETSPEWEQLARCVSNDLGQVNLQIAALADSVASGSDPLTSIGTLLEEAHHYVEEIRTSINARPLFKAVTDEAYTTMFKPLALVEGAIAMAVKVEADIISPTLRVVHELLNEAQNSLADVVLGVMLPVPRETKFTPAAIKAAFQILQTLLDEASATDESHDWSGNSDRLLRIAHGLADEAMIRTPADGAEVDCVAYDIAALVRAARLVPGDHEGLQRKALLDQAAVHLQWLAEAGPDMCDPGAPRPAAPNQPRQEKTGRGTDLAYRLGEAGAFIRAAAEDEMRPEVQA